MTSSDDLEAQYFCRLLLLVQESTRVLRAIFDNHIPPPQLMLHLTVPRLKQEKLLKYQIDRIQQHKCSSAFDVALLSVLLQHFVYTSQTTDLLWKEKDNSNIGPGRQCDISQVVRIRNVRHEVRFTIECYISKIFLLTNTCIDSILELSSGIGLIRFMDSYKDIGHVTHHSIFTPLFPLLPLPDE